MTLAKQLIFGGMFMGLSLGIETLFLVLVTPMLKRAVRRLPLARTAIFGVGAPLALALVFIMASHTAQIALWSWVWIWNDAMPDWNQAIYFSLVTYTTVGYGDITLGPDLRVFGTFASVAGVLGFGISSAFLVALLNRLLHERMFV